MLNCRYYNSTMFQLFDHLVAQFVQYSVQYFVQYVLAANSWQVFEHSLSCVIASTVLPTANPNAQQQN